MLEGTKRLFLKGLGTLLPTLVTLIILIKLIGFVYDNFGRYIGIGIVKAGGWSFKQFGVPSDEQLYKYLEDKGIDTNKISKERLNQIRNELRKQNLAKLGRSWQMALLGFFLALVLIWLLGVFLASFIGRRLWQTIESIIVKIPVFKQIYPYVKQVTDYVFGQHKLEFSRVVAIPYPRKGLWSVGFVTGPAIKALEEKSGESVGWVTVFVPTSPTPLTGFIVTVSRAEVVDLPFTVEQAFKFILSGGVITPEIETKTAEPEKNNQIKSSDSEFND